MDLEVRGDATLGACRFPLVELVFGRNTFEADRKRSVHEHARAAEHRVTIDERKRRRSELGNNGCELGRKCRHVERFGQLDATSKAAVHIASHRR